MSVPLLEVRDLHKSYQLKGREPLEILHGIALQVAEGECRPVCGPSGAGKSTLLHILGGLESPDRGEIAWKGESTRGWDRSRWAVWRRKAVGFVFQSYHLIPELTALQNVLLARMMGESMFGYLAKRGALRREASELLAKVDETARKLSLTRAGFMKLALTRAVDAESQQ